jgi:sulfite reductase (NADPH) flavoprotein alpha-component
MTAAPAAIPLLPESAPFSPAQRAFLNGFFAGLLNLGGSDGAAAPSTPPAAEPEEVFPWHDPTLSIDERLKLADGKPRSRVLMAAMAQLDCGACGYVCRTYAEAIAGGADRDLTKCSPGGKPTATKVRELLKVLPPDPKPAGGSAATAAASPVPVRPVDYGRNNPYPARFVRATSLTGAGSAKDTRHVVVDVKGSGITYKAGDALGVYPENCPEAVQVIIDLLGAKGAEDVPGLDSPHASLREALTRDYSIARVTPELLELMARTTNDPDDARRLNEMAADPDCDALDGCEVIDVLLQYLSARPAPADFVSTLSPLQPRLYSISSSPRLHADEIHLTVGVVRYTNPFGRVCKGVASTHLADRVHPGHRVRVFVHPTHHFTLPSDDSVPVIMIGPGTGVAPFRAFLQERAAARASGLNWLFFGDQHASTDFLYRDELEEYARKGVLTHLDTAFSRDQEKKVYVQHRMLENGRRIWEWLTTGACVYVCGDAKRMAADVDEALHRIVAEHGGMSGGQAKDFVANLSRNRRYQRDVY